MTTTPTPATDAIVEQVLSNPELVRELLTGLVQHGAHLYGKARWALEDNYQTTEWVHERIRRVLPHSQAMQVIREGGFKFEACEIDTDLHKYLRDDE